MLVHCGRFVSVCVVLTLAVVTGSSRAGARDSAVMMCGLHAVTVGYGGYVVDSNDYGTAGDECVATDGNADFTVASSDIDNGSSPGAYPSIYAGCHWGLCSWSGLTSAPIPVTSLTPGTLFSNWSTTQPGQGLYDVSYDIWFNQTPATTELRPDCTELMVWLNHTGSVQPFGSLVANDVQIGGIDYDVWNGQQTDWNTVSYEMDTGHDSVHDLDIGALAQDAVSRGFLSSSCYLLDVEAGFELWQGGAGLATNSFSVTSGTQSPVPPSPSPSPVPTPHRHPSPSPSPSASASASPHASPSLSPSASAHPHPSPSASPSPSAHPHPPVHVSPPASPSTRVPPSAGWSPSASPSPTARRSPAAHSSETVSPTPIAVASRTRSAPRPGPVPHPTVSPQPAPMPNPLPAPSATAPCADAAYAPVVSWPGGFEGLLTIVGPPRKRWQAGWTFPSGQQIVDTWDAVGTQTGSRVTLTSGPDLPQGGSTTVGFLATGPAALLGNLVCEEPSRAG
jgi:Glycosyl hydrolase family 12/Cellulose binding domain